MAEVKSSKLKFQSTALFQALGQYLAAKNDRIALNMLSEALDKFIEEIRTQLDHAGL